MSNSNCGCIDGTSRVITTCNPCTNIPVIPPGEPLQSQIENFTLQFFGEVIKTEVNGEIVWSLPCGLDVGLPNNPRGAGEGLACYFQRLFAEGIVGLTGPAGPAGTAGNPGNNAYTVTLRTFAQPTLSDPVVQVFSSYNPAIVPGLYVFIQTSGWYAVDAADLDGTLTLILSKALTGAPASIIAGRLIIPSGYPGRDGIPGANGATGPQGASVKGDKGDKGDTGATGPVGPAGGTAENGFYYEESGTNYDGLTTAYSDVDFTNSLAQVTLGDAGVYLITAVVGSVSIITSPNILSARFNNATTATEIPGVGQIAGFSVSTNIRRQVIVQAITTTSAFGDVIRLQAKLSSTTSSIRIDSATTTITYVRLA